MKVNSDIKFEISSDNINYKILDENDKEVKTKLKKYTLSSKDISKSNGKVEPLENDTNYYTTGTFIIHPNEDISIYYCDNLACNQGYKKIN